jgi:hypothetical protein
LKLLWLRSEVISDADTLFEGGVLIINAVCIILSSSDLEIMHLAISIYIMINDDSSY